MYMLINIFSHFAIQMEFLPGFQHKIYISSPPSVTHSSRPRKPAATTAVNEHSVYLLNILHGLRIIIMWSCSKRK